MLTITEPIPDFAAYESRLGYQAASGLFFDIETTGLSPSFSIVFLIGAVYQDAGTWRLTQWLARDAQDEPVLLQAFFDMAQRFETLIHFNGSAFDLPFLKARAAANRLHFPLDQKASVDLYRTFRPLKRLFPLDHMNQSSLERLLGWTRRDRLSGAQVAALYAKYAASQEPGLRDLLLLHNHDDLLGMTALPGLCACCMLMEGRIRVADVSAGPSELALTLILEEPLPDGLELYLEATYGDDSSEDSDLRGTLAASGGQAALTIPGIRGSMYHFFPDYRNYYYLPLEDQAIHKSVASFVDREYRVPATASNCYIKKSGLFFPQPKELFLPAFRRSFASGKLYFAWTPGMDSDPDALTAYAAALLPGFRRP